MNRKGRAALAALAAVCALLSWQALTVRFNYGGNWTALYQMGDLTPLPESLKAGSYFWTNHEGYEGEESRIVAHDPFNARGWGRYLDDPETRYTRWLMPAMAHAMAFGRAEWVDRCYLAAFLLFAAIGTYAMSLEFGAAGLIFVMLPATLISMDRLTVNISLAALAAVAVVARRREAWVWFWLAVALAPAAHPQGWVLPAAALMVSLRWKRWIPMALAAACAVPGILVLKLAQDAAGGNRLIIDALLDWLTPWSLEASIRAFWAAAASPLRSSGDGALILVMHVLDEAALVSIAAVAAWTVWRFRARSGRFERWSAVLLVVAAFLVDAEHHLAEPFMWLNYGTPLLLMHWVDTPRHLRVTKWAPLLICFGRTGYQFGFQVLGVLRGLLG